MPVGYKNKDKDKDEHEDEDDFDVNKLVKSETYRWPDYSYGFWDEYSIFVITAKLEFDKDIINETYFSN